MTTLPDGWRLEKLGNLCSIARGGSPRPIKDFLTNDPNGINWVKISDATASSKYIYETKERIKPEGIRYSRLVNEGDFILSNSMSFGRPYIMKTSGCIHDGWLVLKDKSGLFDQDYLYYFLGSNTTYKQFDNLAAGSTVRNLNTTLVQKVEIVIPPLEVQKRIVKILDKAFEGIERAIALTKQNLLNARELFDSYLNNIFTNKGDDWVEKKLGDICTILMGQSPPSSSYNSDGIGVPLINGPVEFGGIEPFSKTVATKFTTQPKKMCEVEDLILCVRGSTTGRMNIAGQTACIGRGVAAIRAKEKNNQDWINQYISFSRNRIYSLGSGATFPNITSAVLESMLIALPSKQEEKINILNKIDKLSPEVKRLEEIYQKKIALLEELKQSILERAFRGELTANK
ncbi:restriction endonuclease subunit S [Cyanobacterium aponinum FACHB-4101]|uniref:restriction endonuclease subunit S n=1 Tax=Cyanobacterium aponinum TaxID=379064 RepID=UPI001680A5B9|nr:restriction endonuclease subunit S [Cyanobacterium aponinum]MBD2395476.1 restriction endonuclease subunit S [Cyanobacterium aponinum FACHB-4101]